eukprot:Selendium_serpulae@DN6114_c0_g1_i1.p1
MWRVILLLSVAFVPLAVLSVPEAGAVETPASVAMGAGAGAPSAAAPAAGSGKTEDLEALKEKIRAQISGAGEEKPRNHLDDNPKAAARFTAYAPPDQAHIHKQAASGAAPNQVMDEATRKEHEDDFKYFDMNKDGVVDGEEMRVVFVGMGDVAALDEMMQFFEDVDTDHSGTISWDEYYQYALLTTV